MDFECSPEDFAEFESIVEDDMLASFTFHLELVLLGLKPATSPSVPAEVEEHIETMKDIGLHLKRVKLYFVNLDELPDYARELDYDRPYHVAKNKEHLDILSQTYGDNEEKRYDRDFALFHGYPEEDIDWFMNQEGNLEEIKQTSRHKLGNPDDFDFVISAIGYIPKPTQKRYRRAQRTAKKYIKAIREADCKFHSDIGRKLIEVQCENVPENLG